MSNLRTLFTSSTFCGSRPFLSFEIFPPKNPQAAQKLQQSLPKLVQLQPTYISVTYGAGGNDTSHTASFELCDRLQNHFNVPTVAHYTCIGKHKPTLTKELQILLQNNIQNYMLLRGDIPLQQQQQQQQQQCPKQTTSFSSDSSNAYQHAHQLVQLLRSIRTDVCIGVAGYPEVHTEASSMEIDLIHLKQKVDAGADFVTTQMFYQNDLYNRFCQKASKIGITVPIIPGIMPIGNFSQIQKIASLCGAAIPSSLSDQLHKAKNHPDTIMQIGTEFAIRQCQELLQQGAPGLHFYTLNHSDQVLRIIQNLRLSQKIKNVSYQNKTT